MTWLIINFLGLKGPLVITELSFLMRFQTVDFAVWPLTVFFVFLSLTMLPRLSFAQRQYCQTPIRLQSQPKAQESRLDTKSCINCHEHTWLIRSTCEAICLMVPWNFVCVSWGEGASPYIKADNVQCNHVWIDYKSKSIEYTAKIKKYPVNIVLNVIELTVCLQKAWGSLEINSKN